MKLQSHTALVTGGAIRIGRAICEALAAKGCNVVIHCHTSRSEALKLAGKLERSGVRAWVVQSNLETAAGCRKTIAEAWRKAGRIDFLINNAAMFRKDSPRNGTKKGRMALLRINFLAPVALTRRFASRIKKPSHGKIVNLLDRRITADDSSCASYLTSKKMLADFTRTAALELAPRITVNGVAPGPVLARPAGDLRASRERAGVIPLGKRPTPEDVAGAVVFLLESDSITGQTIFVDGGQHLMTSAWVKKI
jgi:pteridine reductase